MLELHAIFKGQVQGVGFRETSKTYAKKLGLTGIVKNLSDGSVELIVQGEKENLDHLIHQLEKEDFLGKIHEIMLTFSKPKTSFSDFTIIQSKIA